MADPEERLTPDPTPSLETPSPAEAAPGDLDDPAPGEEVAEAVAETTEAVVEATAQALAETSEAVMETAQDAAQAMVSATEAAASAASTATQQAQATVQQAAQTVTAATQQAAQTVTVATQQAAQTVTVAGQQAQAVVQQAAQRATVSPRKALYRGRRFAVGYALVLLALGFLGALARRHHILPGDVGITRLIQRGQGRPYALLMSLISELGWQGPSVVTRLTATGLTWAAGFRMESAFIVATWSGDIVTGLIKETVGRPRPTRDLVRVTYTLGEKSFPSGHVVHYVTFYGFLFYMVWIYLKQGKWRNVVLILLALLVLMVGPSRVYQGAHWPSDVGAAYLVGALWLAVQIVVYIEVKARFQLHTHWPFFQRRTKQL